ncbi:hypothetical protein [Pantoea dispersa]|uniref:hypothetical protein n=1 Tax=Pantoea dispersa TaxID=59814 RepID=UPI0018A7E9A5|nr:hypothetical protein [Pantoea dispersa]QZY97654.1 hypothetical protein K7X52_23180 [Pantoea dispersa]
MTVLKGDSAAPFPALPPGAMPQIHDTFAIAPQLSPIQQDNVPDKPLFTFSM